MDLELAGYLAADRLKEARRRAAHWHLVDSLRPARRPVRVAVGLALIRLGRALAAKESARAGSPDRATA
jgi:hypothetical protein